MATHSSILAWEMPWTEETSGLQSKGVAKESDTTELLNNKIISNMKCSEGLHTGEWRVLLILTSVGRDQNFHLFLILFC